MGCIATMTALYILLLSALTFLLLESINIVCNHRSWNQRFTSCCVSSSLCLFLTGVIPSLIFTTVTFVMLQPSMMTDQMMMCWVDMGSQNNFTWLAPVTCLNLTSLLTLTLSYQSPNTREWVGRSMTMATTRHSVLAIILIMTGVSILGPMSYTATLAHTGVVITYQIFRILLIVAVLVRTLSDDQVTKNLRVKVS